MLTIGIASLKGGVSKTTLTVALGVEGAARGRRVILVDTDPSGSLTDWYEAREAEAPAVAVATAATLSKVLAGARKQGYDLAFVDTPPGPESIATVRAVVHAADMVLVPIKPSPTDLRTLGKTLSVVKDSGKPFLLALTQTIAKARLTAEALAALSELGPVAPSIANRTSYAAAMVDGRSAQELEPSGPAALEIRALYAQIMHQETKVSTNKDRG